MVARGLQLYGTKGGHLFPEWSHILLERLSPPLSLTRLMDLYVLGCGFVWPSLAMAANILVCCCMPALGSSEDTPKIHSWQAKWCLALCCYFLL